MARITTADLYLAAEWLEMYEDSPGSAGQSDACQRVADYLRQEIARRDNRAAIASVAKEHGVTPAQVRRAIAKVGTK